MELHQQIELIDRLLVEATQQREVLEHTMHAQQRTGTEGASNAPGTFVHPEPYTFTGRIRLVAAGAGGLADGPPRLGTD